MISSARMRVIEIRPKARISAVSTHFKHSPCSSISSFFFWACPQYKSYNQGQKRQTFLLWLTSTAVWLITTTYVVEHVIVLQLAWCITTELKHTHSGNYTVFSCRWRYNLEHTGVWFVCVCACMCVYVCAHVHALIQPAVMRNYMYV